jgi:hypothetical protein
MSYPVSKFKNNPDNPRIIKDQKFAKLLESVKTFPEMMEKRPMVCVNDSDGMIYPLGGNMRLKAIKELGHKEIPENWVSFADDWTEEQKQEFIIRDNIEFGEWDFDSLANEWDIEKLQLWGLDLPFSNYADETYTTKIESPVYTPKGEKPSEGSLYNLEKYNALIEKINSSDLEEEKKKSF